MPKPKIIKEIQKPRRLMRRRIKTRSELEEEIFHAENINVKEMLKKREEEEIEKREKEKKDESLEKQLRVLPTEQPIEKRKEREEPPPVINYAAAKEQKQEYRIMGQEPQERQATYSTAQSESEHQLSRRDYSHSPSHEKEIKKEKHLRYRTDDDN